MKTLKDLKKLLSDYNDVARDTNDAPFIDLGVRQNEVTVNGVADIVYIIVNERYSSEPRLFVVSKTDLEHSLPKLEINADKDEIDQLCELPDLLVSLLKKIKGSEINLYEKS